MLESVSDPKLLVQYISETFQFSERRSCKILSLSRSTIRYVGSKTNEALVATLRELALSHPRYGSPRLAVLIRKRGFYANHKKIERLCRIEGLTLKRRKKRRIKIQRIPTPMIESTATNVVWGMDFVHDKLINGCSFRCLTIVDHSSKECPGILVKNSIKSDDVISFLEDLRATKALPNHFNLDNGSQFISNIFVAWCTANRINIRFIQPGKPIENPFIESFNGKFRDECLNLNKFKNLRHATVEIEKWRNYYNHERPHSSLNYRPPIEATVPNLIGDSE